MGLIRIIHDRVIISESYVSSPPTVAPQREFCFADLASSSEEIGALGHLFPGFLTQIMEFGWKELEPERWKENAQVGRLLDGNTVERNV